MCINNNGGTADDFGIFRIHKYPGDENCTDNTYAITVEFILNHPEIYDLNDPNVAYAVYSIDYYVRDETSIIPLAVTNGIYKGSVTIPAGQSYVDVIIEAKDDGVTDDNENVFLDVTRAYSTQSLAANKLFTVGETGGSSVLIKEVGWAIKSVVWAEDPYGNELIGKWTGKSIYADKNTPSANNAYRNVDVIVTVEGLLPTLNQGGGTVTLVCLDPANASGTGAANYDGTNIFYGTSTSYSLTFYSNYDYNYDGDNNKMTQKILAIVGDNAGDNYKIKATANNGNPNNGIPNQIVHSETLTVWRRLWVECDFVKYWDEEFNGSNIIIGDDPISLPSPENYLAHSKQELEKACVQIEMYDNPNSSPLMYSHNPMKEFQLANAIRPPDKTQDPNAFDPTGRDLPARSTPEFWTVWILMTIGWPRRLLFGAPTDPCLQALLHTAPQNSVLRVEHSMFAMNDPQWGQRILLKQAVELVPLHRFFLIATIQPAFPCLVDQPEKSRQ